MGAPDGDDVQLEEAEVDDANGATRERGAGAGNSLKCFRRLASTCID